MRDLCDIIPDKDKRGIIMSNNCFVLHEEVIDVFHVFFNIPTIEKLSFHLSHVSILGSMKCGKTRNDFLTLMHQKNINLKMIMQKNSAKRPV